MFGLMFFSRNHTSLESSLSHCPTLCILWSLKLLAGASKRCPRDPDSPTFAGRQCVGTVPLGTCCRPWVLHALSGLSSVCRREAPYNASDLERSRQWGVLRWCCSCFHVVGAFYLRTVVKISSLFSLNLAFSGEEKDHRRLWRSLDNPGDNVF